jgi:V/A-type H+/Na+-transporting ATPase subunit I
VIIKMHKYLIWGSKNEMDRFFMLAQRAGFLEFIGLSHKKAIELPEDAKTILTAIKIAKHHFIHPKDAPPLEPLLIAQTILKLHQDEERLLEEKRVLTAEISRIAIFGTFSRDDLVEIERSGKRVLQFFCMKSDLAREMVLPPEVIFVGTEYDLDYFVSVNKERTQYPKMIEILIDASVGELKQNLLRVQGELARCEADLRLFCNALLDLQNGFNDCLNKYTLNLAKHDASTPLGDAVFAIEAWVPKNRRAALFGLLSNLNVQCEEVTIESTDRIPTCVENRGIPKLGEDLIYIYDVPASTDLDPSAWILWFFALFFAMIISDAGYGLIFLIIALVLKWKIPKDAPGPLKRFTKLFMVLSIACIVWGCATASYFGIEIGAENPLRKTSFIDFLAKKKAGYHLKQKDDVYQSYLKDYPGVATAADGHDFLVATAYVKEGHTKYKALEDFFNNILLELSLVVGIIHLSTAFCRWMLRNPAGLGWILFMIGGYLYFPVYLDATSIANFTGLISKSFARTLGLQLLAVGPAIVLIVSIFQGKKWLSIFELTNGIQVFSDVLSYLRLYALALAGMVMADTVNTTLGIELGIIATIFVVLFGHLINISLSSMSATIHGLRLNFLEWYRFCFEGGGRLFNPLRIRKVK